MTLSKLVKSIKDDSLIITPRLHVWLMQNNGMTVSDDVAEIIRKMLVSQGGSRSGGFHPSQIGGCQRAHMFTYLGAPGRQVTDSALQNLFNDGTWRHMRWQAMLLDAGILDKVEVGIRHKQFRVTGSMDGSGPWPVGSDKRFGFELKGTRAIGSVLKNGIMDHHKLQVASYFLLRPDLEYFSVIYEDKASQEWKEFVVHRDDKWVARKMRVSRAELVELNTARKERRLPPILGVCKNGKGPTFRGCAYRDICHEAVWPKKKGQVIPT